MSPSRDIYRAAQGGLDCTALVLVDETGTTTSMTGCAAGDHGASRSSARARRPTRSPTFASALKTPAWGLPYLPPYSPGLNPIEQVFAKLKTLLRRAARRSFDAVYETLKVILERFKPSKCSD